MYSIKFDKSISYLSFNKDKSILGLCNSNLTNTNWNGSFEYFESIDKIEGEKEFSNQKPKQSIDFYSGITNLEWLDNTKCLVAGDDSNIYLVDTTLENSNNNNNNQSDQNIYSENDDDILFKNAHHNNIISYLNYNENTKQLLSSGYDKFIKQWDLNTNCLISQFNLHYRKINMSIWSNFNNNLFLSCSDNGIVVWDSRININNKDQEIKSLFLKELSFSVLSCIWDIENENSFYIGLKNGEIRQYDIRNNVNNYESFSTWKQHELAINQIKFNPKNPNQLLSCSDDCLIKSLNIKSNDSISNSIEIYKSNDFIKSFDFDLNNNLYFGSIDKTLKKIQF